MRESAKQCVSVCECRELCVCERERVCTCTCVSVTECGLVCVCLCVQESARESARAYVRVVSVCMRERE